MFYSSINCFLYREEVKPAECTICERTFKNVQALNGHMRCHGGYFKKVWMWNV